MKKGVLVAISSLIGCTMGILGQDYLKNKIIREKDKEIKKYKDYYHLLNQWFIIKEDKKLLADYFEKQGYKTIAIYGMGELGNHLLNELKETSIEVKYAIDKNINSTAGDTNLRTINDEFECVDAIIVTAIFAFDEIRQTLSEKCSFPIISLEEVVFNI